MQGGRVEQVHHSTPKIIFSALQIWWIIFWRLPDVVYYKKTWRSDLWSWKLLEG